MKVIWAIKSTRAFTLIEVLMAMSLLGVMVVLLFGTLKISAESWEKGDSKIAEVNEMAVVYNFFRRHLLTSKPLWDDFTEPGVRVLGFQGNVQSLQFVSAFPASAERAGTQLFTVKYQDQFEPASVEVSITPFYPANDGAQLPKDEVTLIKGVSHFELAYYGESAETGQVAWHDHWLDQEALPKMVKVDISLTKGGYWPVMVFPLKVSDTAIFFSLDGASGGEEGEEGGEDDSEDEGMVDEEGENFMDDDLGADEE